tara:strand:- start:476 stop:931 length:456 start_codon:yes stop_codon:yes gene_type:complete
MLLYYNITGNTATTLELKENYANTSKNPTDVYFANIHASDAVSVDLYITRSYNNSYTEEVGQDQYGDSYVIQNHSTGSYAHQEGSYPWPAANTNDFTEDKTIVTYYYIKGLVIPVNTSLRYDYSYLEFDRDKYVLKIKLNNSDSAVDIMIK